MTGILAIDTATDACSVAVYRDGQYQQCLEVIPRRHNERLFAMLSRLLPAGRLGEQGIDAIAYGCGPGSFTGLRIAASAVQGLAFANGLPCIPVSTLLCQAQGALRSGLVTPKAVVLSAIDARIHQLYWAVVGFEDDRATLTHGPRVCAPADLELPAGCVPVAGVGDGFRYREEIPAAVRRGLQTVTADLLPSARDMIPLALADLQRGAVQDAHEVSPVYVREGISWKKIADQGRA